MIKSTAVHVNPQSAFVAGYNNLNTGAYEVIERLPAGQERVLIAGLSQGKANAIALILNAPEDS